VQRRLGIAVGGIFSDFVTTILPLGGGQGGREGGTGVR
jgi:hypothetical protein